jgi:hypothetical protein
MGVNDDTQELEFPGYMTTQEVRRRVDGMEDDMPG